MEDHEFKVGDKVVLVQNRAVSINEIGTIGWVTEVGGRMAQAHQEYRVSKLKDKLEGGNWSYASDLLPLKDHEFKVGDKVILTGNTWNSPQNSVGVVGFITEVGNASARVSKTNDFSEAGNWHPYKDIKLCPKEEYFSINELKLNLGDVVFASGNGINYTKDDKGLKDHNSNIYLSRRYFPGGAKSQYKGFKVISRATVERERKCPIQVNS
jgi:hypothetical protein